ncbi:uncharacterized protein LOC110902401 [Helianthus annuus]|uniref:uncharacterized protein LOC110902401 n=1 Tax=Helianthus annuus TaxID=4232 RepID=UPI000B8F0E6C|nr:uncharacterized protein LOC110902401 [Helianthus annuus]
MTRKGKNKGSILVQAKNPKLRINSRPNQCMNMYKRSPSQEDRKVAAWEKKRVKWIGCAEKSITGCNVNQVIIWMKIKHGKRTEHTKMKLPQVVPSLFLNDEFNYLM